MTIGLIYPPRLRTSHNENIEWDPAEINTLSSSSHLPPNELQKSTSLPSPKRNSHNRRHRRNVSFHNQVTVVEVERVPKSETPEVWWSFREMDRFRSEAAKSKDRRRRGMKRCARSSDHARTVLVQQSASEELDGIKTDPKTLSIIARNSSKKARESAHRMAQKLEEEIEKEVYSHERSNSIVIADFREPLRTVENRRIADFYWGAVVDAFTDTVTCGMATQVAH